MDTRMQAIYWSLAMSSILGTKIETKNKPYTTSPDRSRATMKIKQKRKTRKRIASDSKRRNRK